MKSYSNLLSKTGLLLALAGSALYGAPAALAATDAKPAAATKSDNTKADTTKSDTTRADTTKVDVTKGEYYQQQQDYRHQADSCDLINAREILQLSTEALGELKKQSKDITTLFRKTKSLRDSCYELAANRLDDALATGLVYNQNHSDDVAFQQQLDLDQQLTSVLGQRRQLSKQLLDSMQSDVESALKTYKHAQKDKFYPESALTKELIKRDMGLVQEVERRQLALDEMNTMAPADVTTNQFAELKLKLAQHYLSRALLVFEDTHVNPPLLPLARLRSEFMYASAQLTELLAMDPELAGLPEQMRAPLFKLTNKYQLLELDIDGALRDYRTGTFEEDLSNWLSELYQDLSDLALETRTILQHIPTAGSPSAQAAAAAEEALPPAIAAAADAQIAARTAKDVSPTKAPEKPAKTSAKQAAQAPTAPAATPVSP